MYNAASECGYAHRLVCRPVGGAVRHECSSVAAAFLGHARANHATSPRYPNGCAAPGDVQGQCNARGPLSKLEETPPQGKIDVTSKSPVGDISVVTLIRTDTTLDHSQKAEKV